MCLSCTCTHRLRCPRRWRRHMEPGVWSLFANIYLWERYHTTSYKNLGAIGRHRLAKIELEAAQGRGQVPGQSHKFMISFIMIHATQNKVHFSVGYEFIIVLMVFCSDRGAVVWLYQTHFSLTVSDLLKMIFTFSSLPWMLSSTWT